MTASQSNAFDRTGPSINGKHFRKASLATVAAIKQHNARSNMSANISTEQADRKVRPRQKARALV